MNWDMLGHAWAVELLRQHVASGNFRHAYLFTGPQGVGRRTIALRLAQALNCPQPAAAGEPCLRCKTCTQIEQMQHPDLAVVHAEQAGGTLKVDQIRDLQRSLSLAPYASPYRIALLLRFEEAHISAQNAFLKTLEEPPPRVVILITAESSESLLPTVGSRCEVIRLRTLPLEKVSQGLQQRWGLPPDQATLLAHLSGGRPGYALSLYHHPELVEAHRAWLEDHAALLHASLAQRFEYAEKLVKDRDKLRAALRAWLSFWRDVLIQSLDAKLPLTNLEWAAEVTSLARQLGTEPAHRMINAIERASQQLEHNVNPRLAVEVLLLDLPVL